MRTKLVTVAFSFFTALAITVASPVAAQKVSKEVERSAWRAHEAGCIAAAISESDCALAWSGAASLWVDLMLDVDTAAFARGRSHSDQQWAKSIRESEAAVEARRVYAKAPPHILQLCTYNGSQRDTIILHGAEDSIELKEGDDNCAEWTVPSDAPPAIYSVRRTWKPTHQGEANVNLTAVDTDGEEQVVIFFDANRTRFCVKEGRFELPSQCWHVPPAENADSDDSDSQ